MSTWESQHESQKVLILKTEEYSRIKFQTLNI